MIKCIIIEDEMLAQDVLKDHIKRSGKFQLVAVCNNATEAGEVLQKEEVDIMFLDIHLPGMNGLHFLRSLQNPPLVVLTTAYAEYALESYEFNVIDYLLKPISFERFNKALQKISEGRFLTAAAKENDTATNDHIFIKSGNKFFKVNFSEIVFIEGMKDYLKIHTTDYKLVTHQTMNEMEQLLPAKQFMRVHRSYIVALTSIKSVYGNSIDTGKATIPIGINYKEKVMQLVGKRM